MRVVLLAVVLVAGCTDVELQVLGRLDNLLAVDGELCTSGPETVPAPTRFVFLVDNSTSMEASDPNGYRFDAVREVIALYAEEPSVSFAIARWGDDVRWETNGFTSDTAILADALDRSAQPDALLGTTTNYMAALEAARDLIDEDVMLETDEGDRVQYVVHFITDGMPVLDGLNLTDGIAEILHTVDEIVAAAGDDHTCRLDVVLFADGIVIPPELIELLPDMAERGGGRYLQVYDPYDVVVELPHLSEVDTWVRSFELREVLVGNRTIVVTGVEGMLPEVGAYLDSDGDGLVDLVEEQLETSPYVVDTDWDGASDLVEGRLALRNPLVFEETEGFAGEPTDSDLDGLNDREEHLLGLRPDLPDTDQDGIPDGAELRAGTDPMLSDALVDYDYDGISNIDEIRQGTSPNHDEGDALREELAYRAGVLTVTERAHSRLCYRFSVDNLRLTESPAVGDRLGGANTIVVVAVDAPGDHPHRSHHAFRATRVMAYRDGMRDPNRLRLPVTRRDFQTPTE